MDETEKMEPLEVFRYMAFFTYGGLLILQILSWFGIHWLTFTRTVDTHYGTITSSISLLGMLAYLFIITGFLYLIKEEQLPALRVMGKILLVVWIIGFCQMPLLYFFPESGYFIQVINMLRAYATIMAFGCILRLGIKDKGKWGIGILCIITFITTVPMLMPVYQTRFLAEFISVIICIGSIYGWNMLINSLLTFTGDTSQWKLSWRPGYAEWGFLITTGITFIGLYIAMNSL